MNADVVGPSVAGQPVVHITAFVVVMLLAFARTWAESLVTVAHEGGHVVMAVLTWRRPAGFAVGETKGGGLTTFAGGWGAGAILVFLSGYLTPPLAGLLGANLVLAGRSWSLLWASLLLLLGAFFQARGLFTNLIVLLAGGGIGWVAAQGSDELQAGVAVGLVWLMLIGGVTTLVGQGFGTEGSDAAQLAHFTLIPRIFWVALFWFVAIICLWVGGRRLLGL